MNKDRRVVVTGLGPVSAVGFGKKAYWDAVLSGKSNNSPVDKFDTSSYLSKTVAQIKYFDPSSFVHPKTLRRIEQFNVKHGGLSLIFAATAAELALQDSGLDLVKEDKKRMGSMVGAACGDIALTRGIEKPNFQLTQYAGTGSPNGCIAFQYGLRGPCYVESGACATGNLNFASGFEKIRQGRAEIMFVGSTSALIFSPHPYADYAAKGSPMTSQDVMRPFDKNRDGFILGEGAGVLILEELEHALQRNARIYAEVIGYGEATDTSTHFADVTKQGYVDSLRSALDACGLKLCDLDKRRTYLNAHGTGTRKNDEEEMNAVREVFGGCSKGLAVSSIKGTISHPQEAASSLELIASALALEQGEMPPSTNIKELDESFADLRIIKDNSLKEKLDLVIKNASGFCGVYSTIILSGYAL